MVRWLVLGSWLIVACRFDPRAAQPDAADVDAAEPDADLGLCTPAAKRCDGRVREVCGDDQRWDPEQATTCAFTCARGECVADSNVPIESVAACAADAPRFAPAAGTKIDLGVTGGVHLICTPDCGDPGVTRIDASGALIAGDRRFAWFCLSSIAMPDGASFAPASVGEALPAIAFVVDGDVDIAGTIDFSGALATAAVPGGRGGPGGFDGADRSDGSGNTGRGPCPGLGGANSGSGNHWIGGGGGGGGHATAGGPGGAGRCSNNDHNAAGRPGGEVCGGETLIPLVGGSGGGSGGDGTTSVQQGWAGGGGGGAIQISSRTRITIAPTGALLAAGGDGFGNSMFDGGGGGGAGGAILLEAPALVVQGTLRVDGGAGGSSGAGPGGTGASGASGPSPGLTFQASGQGGSGGGGAGGRIRLNGVGATCPATASPAVSCSAGELVVEEPPPAP